MSPTREWAEWLQKGKDWEQQAQQEICDAYTTLDTLSAEATELGQRLQKERSLALASPVTLAAAVARQQVELARGCPWYPLRSDRATMDHLLGLSRLSGEGAAGLLAEELNTLALALLSAADSVPERLAPAVRRCAASLVQVAALLDETLMLNAKPRTPAGPVRVA